MDAQVHGGVTAEGITEKANAVRVLRIGEF